MVSINSAARMNLLTQSSVDSEDLSLLVQELREVGFDSIRFSSYRTAAKLRYIQKKANFVLLDLWNVIESIRENGLNALDPYSIINVPKLEAVVISLYVNLNKRLPVGQQVEIISCARYLLSWLLIAYDNEGSGRVRVFSVKIGLVTLCNGKLIDKLRYIFSQISDANGHLVLPRFAEFLQELLALPTMVLESPTFGYTDGLAATIFDGTSKVFVNGFLDALLSEPGPPCLMWLPLLHTMALVEDLKHQISCNVCKVGNIQGFRYKCQKCSNFNMCQNCFWQGKTSDNHRTDHEVKEYSSNKSSGNSFRNSFRKSLRCVPEKSRKMPRFPDQPERPYNLSYIVPPSPLPTHNGFAPAPANYEHLDAYTDQKMFAMDLGRCPNKMPSYADSLSESDEEHRLIARYTARLASESKYPPAPMYKPMQHCRTLSQTTMNYYDTTQTQRDMIAQLENRNREIMMEIAQLRAQQEMDYMNGEPVQPILMEELEALRYHKSDLEDKLYSLQDSRRHLMGQMEGLMKLLNAQQLMDRSPSSSSPRSVKSPPSAMYNNAYASGTRSLNRSAPTTPRHTDAFTTFTSDLRSGFGGSEEDFSQLTSRANYPSSSFQTGANRYLKNDLLLAADSVSTAMSSLVKELNTTAGSDEESSDASRRQKLMNDLTDMSPDELKLTNLWKQDLEKRYEEDAKYLTELRAQRLSNGNVERDILQAELTREACSRAAADNIASCLNAIDDETFAELYDNDPDDLNDDFRDTTTEDDGEPENSFEKSFAKCSLGNSFDNDNDANNGEENEPNWESDGDLKRWAQR